MSKGQPDWDSLNYFNYFTEVEEHFQRARGTGLFLLSTLDWALIESWKNAGIPLEAVLRGIDAAFERWRARKSKTRAINSLAYCTQEVLSEAQRLAGLSHVSSSATPKSEFCTADELRAYLLRNAAEVRAHGTEYADVADTLDRLAGEAEQHLQNLEALDQRLTVLEEKLLAVARSKFTEEQLLQARRELASQLRPYRSRMTAEQLQMVEKQFLDRHDFEKAGLPRLSLFYMK